MSDYRVKISVRNARLLRAMERAGCNPGPRFAEAVGIRYYQELLPYLNLQRSPVDSHGLIRECAWALCDYLRASPSDLWSDAQLTPLRKNHCSVDVDADSMQALVDSRSGSNDTMSLASKMEACKKLGDIIDSLPRRQAAVLRDRFFYGFTFDELGEKMGICRQRVRQIEQKALRTLRRKYARDDDAMKDIADAILVNEYSDDAGEDE